GSHAPRTFGIRSPGRAAPSRGNAGRRRPVADGAQRGTRSHQRTLTRRRRLPRQAVLSERARAARRRHPAAARGAARRERRPARRRTNRPRSDRASRDRRRQGSRADRHRIQVARAPDRAPRSRAVAIAAAGIRLAGAARYPDPHRGHARPAPAHETRRGGRLDRNHPRRRLPLSRAGRRSQTPHDDTALAPAALMRLVTRLFASIGLRVAAAVVGSIIAADVLLRRYLEQEIASDLAREARLIAAFAPADSARWPDFAMQAGARLGRRVTLID